MKKHDTPLSKALEARGLTVNEAHKRYGLPYARMWSHYIGRRAVSPEAAKDYERVLGIPKSELRPDIWEPATDFSVQDKQAENA